MISTSAEFPTRSSTATVVTCSIPQAMLSSVSRGRDSSARTADSRSNRNRRSSRFRTCATCIKKWACSECRVAPFFLPESFSGADNAFMGDQIRGFGFLHDGSVDTLNRFHSTVLFVQRPPGALGPQDPGNPGGFPLTPEGFLLRRQVEQFMLAFDSNLAPIVGQQMTLTARNQVDASRRLKLFMERAAQGECDLVAKRKEGGYLYQSPGLFRQDKRAAPLISADASHRPGFANAKAKSRSPAFHQARASASASIGMRTAFWMAMTVNRSGF